MVKTVRVTKAFRKIVGEIIIRGLCNAFEKLIKVIFKNLHLMVALQLQSSPLQPFFLLKPSFIVSFLVILCKSTTQIATLPDIFVLNH